MIQKTTRFKYYENLERSKITSVIKYASKLFFNISDVIPSKDSVDSYEKYLGECDDVADEVVDELFFKQSMKIGHRQLGVAVTQGIDKVENPSPKFKSLFSSLEKDPDWLDREKLEHGAHVCRRLGMDALYALGDLALLGGYANPNISKSLSFTGALKGARTFNRINETTQFWLSVTEKGGMEIGAKGYQTSVHVRMIHALIRKRLVEHPKWDFEAWGLPINAADSLATNIAFSSIMMVGTSMLGTKHSKKDFESVLHLWLYIGYLMGDKIDWLPKTPEEAIQSLLLIGLADDHIPDGDSVQLANDLVKSHLVNNGTLKDKIESQIVYLTHRAYAEFLIPRTLYKRLNLPSSNLSWILVPLFHLPTRFLINNVVRPIFPKSNDILDKEGRKKQEAFLSRRQKEKATFKAEKKEFVR